MIKTSVIIPVYNVEEYLDKCIESVLQQSQKEIEIIVVDDGSTDGSKKKIQYYEKNYSFVKAIYQDNHKLGAARNAGVLRAEGKYIYFLDSDDYIDPFLLEKCYTKAEENNLDFLMFDSKVYIEEKDIYHQTVKGEKYDRHDLIRENKIFSGKEYWKKYSESGGVYTCAYLFYINKQFFTDNKLYFVPEIFYEDNDWVIRLYRAAKRIMYLPEQLYYRRIRGGSIMTSKYNAIHMKSIVVVCRLHVDLLLNALDESEIEMTAPRYISVMHRFSSIFKQFVDEQTVYKIRNEIEILYDEIIEKLHEILQCDMQAGLYTLITINLIQEQITELKEKGYNTLIENIKRIFNEFLEMIPLNRVTNIGVYGTGKRCSEFLDMYEKLYGEPVADLIFIDSVQESGFKYKEYIGYNICDINALKLDKLLITSTLYGDQMEESIREIMTKEVPVVRLPLFLPQIYKIIFGQ